MIPYARHHITQADREAVLRVLASDRLTQGPTVPELERRFAEVCGARYAVACSSGTAALHLAMMADVDGEGRTVAALSFVATGNAAQMDADAQGVPDIHFRDATDRVTGLMTEYCDVPVTLGGQPVEAARILDACHGPYTLPDGVLAACFSLHPAKHVAAGEGGMIVTDDVGFAFRCDCLRDHGRAGGPSITMEALIRHGEAAAIEYRPMEWLGLNYRLDEMSAALALSQLDRLDENIERRRDIAGRYDAAISTDVQPVPHHPDSARHLYQILVDPDDRPAIREALAAKGVGTQVHYHPIIPLQPYYRKRYGYEPGMWPNAEWHSARTLSLPLFPTMTEDEIGAVIDAVLEVCG